MNKHQYRAYCLKRRNDFIPNNTKMIEKIMKDGFLESLKIVGLYYPLKGEYDLLSLLTIYPHIQFCFPKTEKGNLNFYYQPDLSDFKEQDFHVMEPEHGLKINRDDIDAFLIPCVGIASNRRIGFGKGFYDRYLDNYKGLKVGFCYEECLTNDLEIESTDVFLNKIFVTKGEN